jgi:hypothetical protein
MAATGNSCFRLVDLKKNFFSETAWPKWAEIWWEAPMEGSVLSYLKTEWKVTDTGSAQCWVSSFSLIFVRQIIMNWKFGNNNQTYPILIDWLMFGRLTFPWHIFNTYSGREQNSLIYKYCIKMRTLRIFTWQFSIERVFISATVVSTM